MRLVRALSLLVCAAAAALAAPAAAQPADPEALMRQAIADREAIAAASLAFSDAYVRNDMEALGRLYTEHVVLLPPGQEIRGREAAARYFAWPPGHRQIEHSMYPKEVVVLGDVATDYGIWRSIFERDGVRSTASGTYLVVWLREPDGAWRIDRDMWHREPPAAEAAVESSGGR